MPHEVQGQLARLRDKAHENSLFSIGDKIDFFLRNPSDENQKRLGDDLKNLYYEGVEQADMILQTEESLHKAAQTLARPTVRNDYKERGIPVLDLKRGRLAYGPMLEDFPYGDHEAIEALFASQEHLSSKLDTLAAQFNIISEAMAILDIGE